jgi:cryptochrome
MLDERAEKDRCIARIKNAFQLNLHGDSPEVLDGTAPELLRKKHEETGALVQKGQEEVEEEKRVEKRKRSGNSSLTVSSRRHGRRNRMTSTETPISMRGRYV